jgi:Protein of unknown function (DUF3300)
MRKILAATLAVFMLNLTVLDAVSSAVPSPASALPQEEYQYQPYSPEQLENLLAPIALYPDPLLAQVLPASTFVDQVQQAADWVRTNGPNGIDDQDWDVSVKAVGHYPMIIQMMAQRIDWTTSLGQAYVNQSTDVMFAVQHLRMMARSQGNLYSTPQQQVLYNGGYIQIVPAQPRYIYVPTYDPAVVYVRPHRDAALMGVVIGFSAGLLIGAWLSRDCDWREHRVYYDGWRGDRGWRGRSRQYVQVNNVTYVNNTYNNVTINRTVVNRTVNVSNINNYNSVHRNVTYNNVEHNNTMIRRNPNFDRRGGSGLNKRPQERNPGFGYPAAGGNPRNFPNQPVRKMPPASAPLHPAQPAPQPAYRQAPQTTYRPATPQVHNPPPPAKQEVRPMREQKSNPYENKPEMRRQQTPPPRQVAPGRVEQNRVQRHEQKSEKPEKQKKNEKGDSKGR